MAPWHSAADPGFPRREGGSTSKVGTPTFYFHKVFQNKCTKIKRKLDGEEVRVSGTLFAKDFRSANGIVPSGSPTGFAIQRSRSVVDPRGCYFRQTIGWGWRPLGIFQILDPPL